jgi:POT family proton-dependent oligopeptide transporter
MHAEFDHAKAKDVGGGVLTSDEMSAPSFDRSSQDFEEMIHEDGSEYPTTEEIATLRHVPFTLPVRTWLVCVIELCERFCYFGVSGIFNNYISNPYGSGAPYTGDKLPGAIGRGSAFASGLQNFWQFWCYGGLNYDRLPISC